MFLRFLLIVLLLTFSSFSFAQNPKDIDQSAINQNELKKQKWDLLKKIVQERNDNKGKCLLYGAEKFNFNISNTTEQIISFDDPSVVKLSEVCIYIQNVKDRLKKNYRCQVGAEWSDCSESLCYKKDGSGVNYSSDEDIFKNVFEGKKLEVCSQESDEAKEKRLITERRKQDYLNSDQYKIDQIEAAKFKKCKVGCEIDAAECLKAGKDSSLNCKHNAAACISACRNMK